MYRHCIYCKGDLGSNEVIEHFPLGRRLAFDAKRGRLWVVCRYCTRWNLSPIEERWEAIEECERAYRHTTTRLATEQIGLARLPDGLDLVRIGVPQRPEFAAWRYGDQLVRRRRRQWMVAGVGTAVIGGIYVTGIGAALAGITGGGLVWQAPNLIKAYQTHHRTVLRLPAGLGQEFRMSGSHLRRAELLPSADHWFMRVPHRYGEVDIEGEGAMKVAAMIMPHVNAAGASVKKVQSAVSQLQETPDAETYFARTAEWLLRMRWNRTLGKVPIEMRIALEMASHEEQERRALEGELADLEAMWREAEEVAGISDGLLIPSFVSDIMRRTR